MYISHRRNSVPTAHFYSSNCQYLIANVNWFDAKTVRGKVLSREGAFLVFVAIRWRPGG